MQNRMCFLKGIASETKDVSKPIEIDGKKYEATSSFKTGNIIEHAEQIIRYFLESIIEGNKPDWKIALFDNDLDPKKDGDKATYQNLKVISPKEAELWLDSAIRQSGNVRNKTSATLRG